MKTLFRAALAALLVFSCAASAQDIGDNPIAVVSALTDAACALNSSTQNACATFMGYYKPQWFGATGNGTTDDTTAIQNAVNATVSYYGNRLYFPCSTNPSVGYKITSAITVPFGAGFVIQGESRGCVTLTQFTDNTPILHFTGNNTNSFSVYDLSFNWHDTQTSSDTSLIALYFDSGSSTSIYTMDIGRLSFYGGFRGFSNNNNTNQSLWSVHFHDIACGGSMAGACYYNVPNPAVGNPNINLDHLQIACADATEASIQSYYNDILNLKNIEFFGACNTTDNPSQHLVQVEGSNVFMQSVKTEGYAFGTSSSGNALFNFEQSYVTAANITFEGFTGTPSGHPELISSSVSGALTIDGMTVNSSLSGGGPVLAYFASDIPEVQNYHVTGSYVTNNVQQYVGNYAVPREFNDVHSMDYTTLINDANITLQSRITNYSHVLTANRTAQLVATDSISSTAFGDGTEFVVLLTVASPYTLTVQDTLNGNNFVFPAGTTGFVKYRYTGSQFLRLDQGFYYPTQTTLNGTTAGTVVYSQPSSNVNYKKFVAQFSGYENDTATSQTITFPTPFVNTPVITANTTGLNITVTTTTLTINAPDNTTTYGGFLSIEGI